MRKLLAGFLFALLLTLTACGDNYENDYEYDGDEEIQVNQDDDNDTIYYIEEDDDWEDEDDD